MQHQLKQELNEIALALNMELQKGQTKEETLERYSPKCLRTNVLLYISLKNYSPNYYLLVYYFIYHFREMFT